MSGPLPDRVVALPLPPSTNALWTHPGAGRPRTRTAEYRAWLATAGWEARRQVVGLPMLAATFAAELRVPANSRRDRDNWTKPLFDLLQHAGVVRNDSGLRDYRVIGEARADVLVLLWDCGGPEQRQPALRWRAGKGRPRAASPSQVARARRAGLVV